jgi:hypothetical protein
LSKDGSSSQATAKKEIQSFDKLRTNGDGMSAPLKGIYARHPGSGPGSQRGRVEGLHPNIPAIQPQR